MCDPMETRHCHRRCTFKYVNTSLTVQRVCRLQVALKLAHLRHDAGETATALAIARAASSYAVRARAHRNAAYASGPTTASLHASASRSQPTPEATKAMSGLTEADEAVTHLHADIVQLQYELELAVGVSEQAMAGERLAAKIQAKLTHRREKVWRVAVLLRCLTVLVVLQWLGSSAFTSCTAGSVSRGAAC